MKITLLIWDIWMKFSIPLCSIHFTLPDVGLQSSTFTCMLPSSADVFLECSHLWPIMIGLDLPGLSNLTWLGPALWAHHTGLDWFIITLENKTLLRILMKLFLNTLESDWAPFCIFHRYHRDIKGFPYCFMNLTPIVLGVNEDGGYYPTLPWHPVPVPFGTWNTSPDQMCIM